MDRREFLKSTGAAAAATAAAATQAVATEAGVAASASPAVSKGLKELRLAIPFNDGFAGPADYARRLARNIGELSAGRIRVAPAFGIANAADAVRAGDADLFFDTADSQLDMHRAFAYFAGLPGDQGLAPRDLQTWITVGGGQALWDDLAAEAGVKPLLAAHTGSHSFMLATRPVDTMATLAGRTTHVTGLARDVAKGLGLEVVSLPADAIATSLRAGDIEIAECGGAIVSYALQIPAAAPYLTGTSINQNGTAMLLGVRRGLWDSLDAGEQNMISAAAAAEFQLSLSEEEAHRPMLHPTPSPDRIWPIAAELNHAIQRVAAAVVAHAAGTDATSRRIAASFAAFRANTISAQASV